MAEDRESSRERDLDETRRLLYMGLFVHATKRYNLLGTLVNAMRHHQGSTDPGLEDKLFSLVENGSCEDWAREQIAAITESLGEAQGNA